MIAFLSDFVLFALNSVILAVSLLPHDSNPFTDPLVQTAQEILCIEVEMRERVHERYVHIALLNISIIFVINRIGDDQFQTETHKHLPNGNDPYHQSLALHKDSRFDIL